jgi:hypothetical protein
MPLFSSLQPVIVARVMISNDAVAIVFTESDLLATNRSCGVVWNLLVFAERDIGNVGFIV